MTEANMVVATGTVPGSNAAATFDLRADAIAADHGFQHWWFYRLAGDTQEFALKGPATGGVPPHLTHADRDFADVDARGLLRANVDMDIYSAGPASGVLTSRVTFTNLSAVPQTVWALGFLFDRQPWSGQVTYRHVSRVFGSGDDLNQNLAQGVYGAYDAYGTASARVQYRIDRQLSLALALDNLLDRRYYVLTRQPGRTLYAELAWRF